MCDNWILAVILGAILGWVPLGWAQSPTIVGPVSTPEGRLVRLQAQGDFDSCVWFCMPLGEADWVQTDSRSVAFVGLPKTYTVFLVTLKGQQLGQAMGNFQIVPISPPIPPEPPEPPEPDFPIGVALANPPGPLDSLNVWGQFYTRQLGRAYATAFNRAASAIEAGKSMEEAMAAFEVDWKNARTYAFQIQGLKVRLNALWPEGQPLTPDGRKKVAAGFREFANGLKGIK